MARYSCAEWEPVVWMNTLTHHRKTQLAIHITDGEGDPRTIATWRTGRAGSNFVLFPDGRLVQLSDSACKSPADFGATHIISVECVGRNRALTPAQVAALITLAREAHERDGVPLRLAATSSDAGIGWHRLGVDGNFPKGRYGGRLQRSPLGVQTSGARGKACPTDVVIDQIHDVILPALTQEEDFMSELSPTEQRQLYNAIVGPNKSAALQALMPRGQNLPTALDAVREKVDSLAADLAPVERTDPQTGKVVKIPLRQEIANANTAIAAQRGEISGLVTALAQVVGEGVDLDAIREASRQGVADALAAVETTVTVKKG
ncbi:peptidoglycan recognition protein family protein [Streptomyces anthocyanicus]